MLDLGVRDKFFFFFFNDTATTEIYTLSLHDALPICPGVTTRSRPHAGEACSCTRSWHRHAPPQTGSTSASRVPITAPTTSVRSSRRPARSEEHTSELQSRQYLVCRLLLEKKKYNN